MGAFERVNPSAMFVSIGYLPCPRQDYQHPWELLHWHPYYCCCLAVFESSQWERFQLSLWSMIPQLHAKNYSLHLLVLLQLSAALYWAQMPETHLASFVKQCTYRFEQQQLFSTSSPTQQHRTQTMIPYIHIYTIAPMCQSILFDWVSGDYGNAAVLQKQISRYGNVQLCQQVDLERWLVQTPQFQRLVAISSSIVGKLARFTWDKLHMTMLLYHGCFQSKA